MFSMTRARTFTASRRRLLSLAISSSVALLLAVTTRASAQTGGALLASRGDLSIAASKAEVAAAKGEPDTRTQNAMVAAAIHQRLRDGDLQVGDRVVVTVISDVVHRDTVIVRSDRTLELPGPIVVSVAGILRSELHDRVSTEVLKYVKAEHIEVTPLLRVGVMGSVARPGYFAVASDIPLTDAIMVAGGPTGAADVGRSVIRRGNQELYSAEETSKAIANGLTLDQFGLVAGDELVVGQRHAIGVNSFIGITGALASVLALFVALQNTH
jgi:protein involved in polysaccharide export with SLBB domain